MMEKSTISDKLAIITTQQTKEREYWHAKMAGEPVKSFIYYDYPESGDFARQMEAVPFQLTGDLFDRLMRLSNNYDYTLYMILVSGLIVLLDKYTYGSNKDILLGAPIYKQEVEGDLINTVLPLRNHLEDRMTFKELLLQVKDTIVEANKHQNFPIEAILEYLDMSLSEEDFPLFDIAVLLENIHDRKYLRDIPLNMIFSLERMENCIAGVVEYNASRYRAETIMDIVYHFTRVLEEAIANIEGRVSDLNILSEQERKRLLIDFNASAAEYPREKAIHQLFEEQAEKSGDSVVLVGMAKGLSLKAAGGLAPLSTQGYITYRQLNEKSLQLTRLLIEKGVKPGTQNSIVGIMSEGSPEILAGILGILRAGGAYLPISPHYPEPRKKYLAADSNIKILLTDSPVSDYSLAETIIDVNDPGIYRERPDIESAGSLENPARLAYIMYTSGSTGIPKGSLIEHKSVVRLVKNTNFVDLEEEDRILKTGAMEFDASTFEIWGALLNGLRVYLERKDIILIPEKLKERILKYRITTMWMTAPLFNQMVDADIEIFAGLRNLLVGGDVLSPPHILRVRNQYPHLKVINGYGPTENTTFSTTHLIDRDYKGRIPIGKPIANSTAYIVDKNFCLVPPGAVGELLVGGDGVARGYLNSPELTADKFIKNQLAINNILTHPTHLTHQLTHSPIYRTGDLARWLSDGTVDFLGRIDFQVKIRGFRVEMGEIENHILNHDEIREAVVIARHEQTGGQYSLAAYVVGNRQLEPSELREYLSRKLPDYMIPGYFISLDKMPLTPNGKIDRKALPEPELKVGEDYIAPANEVEEKLTEIWSEILGIDKNLISVAADFFDLGGHSLRANVVVSEIHKFFNVKIPLIEIFTTPTIRGLAEYISAAGEERYAVIEPAEEREYYALSPAQKRLYLLHQMEPDSVNYNMPHVVSFPAEVDKEKLARTFKELIKRHESLRTSFEVVGEEPVQRIHEAVAFEVEYYETNKEGAQELINGFIQPFDLCEAPLLRAVLLKVEGFGSLVLLDLHHIISDGASQALLTEEFNRLYSGKGEGLPPLPLQYKDYALWQNSEENRVFLKEQESYWLKVFSDEIPVLNLPLDFPRPAVQSFVGNTIDIKIDDNLASRLNQLAHEQDVTLYMVLLALFNVFLCNLSGQEDIVIGTPVSGRRHGDVQGIMGLFVNTLAVRNFPHHSKSFVDFLKEVKSSSVEAFEHQEYPFEELVERASVQRDPGRNPLFDVMFALERSDTAGVADAAPESHDFAFDYRVAKFDLTLTAMESPQQLLFSFEYCTRLFKEQTMQRFIDYFLRIVATVVEHPELPLGEIYMVGEEEQDRILYEFNDTAAAYPDDRTLVPLFHRQVERTPLRTAVTCGFSQLTYDQLNKRGNRLAFTLKQKGVGPDTLVGILTDRSLEMIAAVLGVLKAGSGYLALDAESPENRIQYIIEDSQPALVLVNGDVSLPETMDFNGQCLWLPEAAASGSEDGNPEMVNSSDHLAYILYTSGTTGRPKGVMIDQGNAAAYVHAFLNEFPLRPEDNVILEAAFIFDVFAEEVYPPLLSGSKICVAQKEEVMDVFVLESFIARHNITHFTSPPLLLNELNRLASLDNLRTVHTFISGVDVLREEYISRLRGLGRFYNVYGPTEATVSATYYKLPEELAATIPIGKPISNYRVYILDKSEKLQGIGVPGEICISGDGVGRGYLNQPELTAEKFVISHLSLVNGQAVILPMTNDQCPMTFYRTGDLGRWLPDGNIEFLGRIDLQVKIRGFRVELGEIESQLSAIGKVKEAVVIAVKESSGELSLCAYVVPVEGESVDIPELRHFLSRTLPAYMVPSYIVPLEKMPLTPSGKVDKRALPEPEAEMAGEVYIGPRNPVEKTLAHLWSEVLGVDKEMLSIDANFFQLGGHSLKANLLVTKINRELAIKVPLTELFKTPSIRGLAEFIKGAERGKFSPIETAEEKAYYPLSSVQKRLFVLHQIAPRSVAYHMTTILGLEGELDKARLEDCFSQLIRRHESLRTSFEVMDGEPIQKVHDEVEFEIENSKAPGGQPIKTPDLIKDFVRPFDLSQAPLLRVGLIETGEREHTLIIDMHHIISDGTSVAVLVAEFMSFYEGRELPELHLHYKDYAQWENREREGEAVKRQEAYWLKEFAGDIPILELPTDFPRPKVQDYEGSTLIFEIGSSDTRGLKALALEEGATLYMVLLAIYNIFLSRLSGQEVIVVGTPTGGRPHADLERVIGMFVNTLALKNEPAGEKTFREFLKEVKETTLSAFAHQDYPYEELVEKVIITRDSSRNPLFDAMFILQNLEVEEFEIPGLKLKPYPIERTTSKFDFTLEGIEGEKRLTYIVEYSTKLFKVETIERFIIYLKRLTSAVLQNPDQNINQLDMVPEEEREQLVKAFNDTAEDFPMDKTIYQLFEEQVDRYPDHAALVFKDKNVTFRYFDERANQLANYLRMERGLETGDRVAVLMERSLELIISLMGVMKGGGAYVPLDPSLPLERLRVVLEDASIGIVLPQEGFGEKLTPLLSACQCLDSLLFMNEIDSAPLSRPGIVGADNPAYVMYTSGSSGIPKGVLVEHRTIVNTLLWRKNFYEYRPGNVSLQNPPYFFDSSITDIFTPLIGGARLVLVAEEERVDLEVLKHVLKDYKISHFIAVPAFYNILVEEIPDYLTHVKMVTVAGEHFPDELVKRHFDRLPRVRIFNEYGPTENSVNSTVYELKPDSEKALIGKPISNVGVYILDRSFGLCPLGVTGEICLAGSSLARGYLNSPELTNKKFLWWSRDVGAVFSKRAPGRRRQHAAAPIMHGLNDSLPQINISNKRVPAPQDSRRRHFFYRTGDLARWLPDGNLEFMGRADSQVKIRGIRVEVAEIENYLLKREDIKEAIVLAHEGSGGDKYLCGYVVPTGIEIGEAGAGEWKQYLSERLPEYMVPSHILVIETIPFTPSGKIDRRALPAPEVSCEDFIAPRNSIEEELAGIWADVLAAEKDTIGIDSDFFQLGGHSLRATTVVLRIHKTFNVKIPLTEIFVTPTIRGLAKYINAAVKERYVSIEPVEKREYYPLSPAQRRLYILHRMEPDNVGYNMPEKVSFPGEIDKEKLIRTFKELIKRHESLRTSFEMLGEEPIQKIHDEVDFSMEHGAWSMEGGDFVRSFDLSRAPLLRVGLIESEGAALLIDLHHIITDGTSQAILTNEFKRLYAGEEEGLPPLRVQYKDYSQWQNSEEQQALIKDQETYWLEMFSDEVPVLNLPYDYSRPLMQSIAGNTVEFLLTVKESQALKSLASEANATLYMSILAVFTILLSKLSSQEDIIVGTPIAGRRHADLEIIIGVFINTLAMRNYPGGEKRFSAFLEEVKERTLAAHENQEYQFENLVDSIHVRRDTGRNPVFDVMFNLLNQDDYTGHIPGIDEQEDGRPAAYQHRKGTSNFDLTLTSVDLGQQVLCVFEYCTKLFRPDTIERFITYFKRLLDLLAKDSHRELWELEIITEVERQQLLYEFNDTAAEYPKDKTIHELFEEQARHTPDGIAVQATHKTYRTYMTYNKLSKKSDQLAWLLREKGVKTGTIAGIMVERSVEMMIGLLGILKTGAAYLPIDPGYPQERINYMLAHSSVGVLVSEVSKVSRLSEVGSDIEVIDLVEIIGPIFKESPPHPLTPSPPQLCYVIYTSGSTGRPKGVMIGHRAVGNFIKGITEVVPFKENDIILSLTTICFDIFGLETFLPLTRGTKVIVGSSEEQSDPAAACRVIERECVTIFQSTPSRLHLLTADGNASRCLRRLDYLLVGGEAFPPVLLEKARKIVDGRIINVYGPTETTIWSTIKDVTEEPLDIGKPIVNTQVYILDRFGTLPPVGVPGELCIGGDGLAAGYINNPELTAEKFVISHLPLVNDNSTNDQCPMTFYRTGDLARWLAGGNIEFLGRFDHQVKVRGYRIELEEIESQLLNREEIKEAVVVAKEEEGGDKFLCAYIVGAGSVNAEELRGYLSQTLPAYMIPSYFVHLEEIPLTPNGKIDRKALPTPEIKAGEDYIAPRNAIEEKVAEIWSEVLKIGKDVIGIDANFFQLGGHSLRATTMAAKIHKELAVALPLAEIFKKPTIRGLAENIAKAKGDTYAAVVPAEKKEYYPLSPAQKRLYILHQMEPDNVSYNVPLVVPFAGQIDKKRLEQTFRELIKRHESLRTSFVMLGEKPVQKIHEDVEFSMEHGAWSIEGRDFVRPFDLSRPPLLRVGLIKSEGAALLIDMHHIITDGTSQTVLTEEFNRLYAGKRGDLPPLRLQYKDYSQWQNSESRQALIKEQETYWLEMFSGEVPVLNLPIDYPRPLMQSFAGNTVEFLLTVKESQTLKALAKEVNTTLYMSILAVFNVLLSKLSGLEDIIVGTPVAGRRHADLGTIIGVFINTLPMKNHPGGEKRFNTFLEDVKKRTLAAYENQEYQFEELVDRLDVRRDTGRNPIFDVMFNLLNQDDYTGHIHGIDEQEQGHPDSYKHQKGISKFDLTLSTVDLGERLFCAFEYCSKLFRPGTIERFIAYFKKLVDLLSMDSNRQLSQLEIITETERHQLLYEFNDTGTEYPRDITIHQLFAGQAERAGDSVALIDMAHPPLSLQGYMTYRQLNEKSACLARLLIEKGVKPGHVVGILGERSVEMILGILAILKVGGIFLPIDADYPEERKHYMLKDSNAGVLVSKVSKGSKGIEVIELEKEIGEWEHLPTYPLTHSPTQLGSASPAYIMYTSGSTGQPKGVLVTHRNVVRLVKNTNFVDFSPDTRILQTGAPVFDATTFEIWGPLLNGGQLVLVSKEVILDAHQLGQALKAQEVNTLWLSAPLFNQLMQQNIEMFEPLRYLVVGGDVLSSEHINKVRHRFPALRVINGYGPTENTTFSTTHFIDTDYSSNIPIGRPIANSTAYIVDKNDHLQPVGIYGELLVGGDGVALGYINSPELTAEKFVISHLSLVNDNSTNDQCPMTFYRTGDLARWLPDGTIQFAGRIDSQVKLRGFRVELGEIESRLLDREEIKDAVLMIRKRDEGEKYLVAYIVFHSPPSIDSSAIGQIRDYLAQSLPDYMIPSYFVQLEMIPLNPNGKVDWKALPEPVVVKGEDYAAPRNTVEIRLVELWSGVLGMQKETIGIDTSFFQLGGNSLQATSVSSNIYKLFNVRIPLAEIFKSPTIRELAKYIADAGKQRYTTILPVEKKEYYPLSSAQRRLYLLFRMAPDNVGYNMPQVVSFPGEINKERLERIFKELIQRHESLRTSFFMVGEEPVQKVHDAVDFSVGYYEPGKEQKAEENGGESIIVRFTRPFDLSRAPLLRASIIKTESHGSLLLLDMHHIINDGASQAILTDEFNRLYTAKEEEVLPSLRVQYKDYSQWQNSEEQQTLLKEQETFWLGLFSYELPVLNLPIDYPRPFVQSFAGNTVEFPLTVKESQTLKTVAKETNATLFMSMLAVFNILLTKLSGQEDIIVGIAVAGRRHADLQLVIGMFVNMLAMRNFPSGGKGFLAFLEEVKEGTLAAYENQEYPFEELVERIDVIKDTGRNPVFDVVLNFLSLEEYADKANIDDINGIFALDEESEGPYEHKKGTAKFDLVLNVVEIGERLLCAFEYCSKLFAPPTIERFIAYFKRILALLPEDSNRKVSELTIITEAEKQQILYEFNDAEPQFPADITTLQLFEQQVEKTPDSIAIHRTYRTYRTHKTYITFNQLNRRSNQLALYLSQQGVRANQLVGLLAERSFEMIIGILGILKAGGAYVPLNLKAPTSRNEYILKECSARILVNGVSKDSSAVPISGLNKDIEVIDINEILIMHSTSPTHLTHLTHPTHLCYVIFTSGSTGKPKGVPIIHSNLSPLLHWGYKHLGIGPKDRTIQNLSYYFDWSVWEMFITLTTGASLCMVPEELMLNPEVCFPFMTENDITVLHVTPAQCHHLIQADHRFECLRYLFLGGETLSVDLLKRIFVSVRDECRVFNMYGPTETTIITGALEINRGEESRFDPLTGVPIGKPVANAPLLVLDKYMRMCPVNVTGELYIAGDGLSHGYLNDPEKTQGVFISNPYKSEGVMGDRLYITGDLARWLPDGAIQFEGRIDFQVKIRGLRVELGEIESRLLEIEEIKEAVVLVRESEGGEKYLGAYIVVSSPNSTASSVVDQLRDYLSRSLPDYMVPSYFVQLEEIPLTSNGKTDWRALLELETGEWGEQEYVPPGNEVEFKLVEIWSELLGIEKDKISINTDFFRLGGHSLKAAAMMAKIQETFDIKLDLVEIFSHPTAREVASLIKASGLAKEKKQELDIDSDQEVEELVL